MILHKSLRWILKKNIRIGAVLVLLVIVLAAAFGPSISPYNLTAINSKEVFITPSFEHPFGTDALGRDILTRVMAGGRLSLLISLSVLAVTILIGGLVGAVAGFFGGWADLLLMRVTEIFLTFPSLVLAMAIAASFGPSLRNTILALSVAWWASYARLLRAKMLEIREEQYIEGARAVGMSVWRVLFRHALPNSLGPIVVRVTNDLGTVILFSTTLGFLGLGPQPPSPEWGLMVATASGYLSFAPYYAVFSGAAIFMTVLAFALLGDEIYESYHQTMQAQIGE